MRDTRPDLGLALGGGGMKGMAHIGALGVLEEVGLKPDLIVGTSIGALVGAFAAAGFSYSALADLLQSEHFLSLIAAPTETGGVVGTTGLRTFLERHLDQRRIEALKTPFVAAATSLETGAVEFFDRGPLVDAVLASASVPGVFPPVYLNDHPYVDGGLVDNLPVDELRRRRSRFVVAVRLYATTEAWDLDRSLAHRVGEIGRQSTGSLPLSDRVARGLARRAPSALVVLQRALQISQAHHEAVSLEQSPPDVLIEPVLDDVGTFDFFLPPGPIVARGVQAAQAVRAGLEAVRRGLDEPETRTP